MELQMILLLQINLIIKHKLLMIEIKLNLVLNLNHHIIEMQAI